MKKILSSLICVGAISTFASANMVNVDLMYSTVKQPDDTSYKFDDDSAFKGNIRFQSYKNNENDNPFVGSFRIGGRAFESDVLKNNKKSHKVNADYLDFELMLGYGLYVNEGIAKTKVNFLAGLDHVSAGIDVEVEGIFSTSTTMYSIETNALKVGVSTLSTFNNGLVTSVDAYIKHYLDDKRKIWVEDNDSDTKFEIDGMIGYKFGKEDNGFMLGLKGGYHNDLISKGGHFGLSLGYVF